MKYAEAHSIEIVGWYTDEGVSAETANRPGLQRMLKDCRSNKGKIEHIIVYNTSRISRNLASYCKDIGYIFARDGITLRSTMEPIDETPMGNLMPNISIAFHQLDNEIKGETSHDNMVGVARNGWWQTQAPVGFIIEKVPIGEYKNDGHERTRSVLKPDLRNGLSDKIATVFTEFANANGGMSEADAWRLAHKLEIRMPNTGELISFSSFDRMPRRPVYAGYNSSEKLLGGKMVKLHFDGIIPLAVFNKVQTLLDSDKKTLTRSPDDLYPLKDTLVCAKCGGHILGSAPIGGSGKKSPGIIAGGGGMVLWV